MDQVLAEREVMNLREASQYLGISPDTLYKYVCEEIVPAFKLGNCWKFKKSILDAWMVRKSHERRQKVPSKQFKLDGQRAAGGAA